MRLHTRLVALLACLLLPLAASAEIRIFELKHRSAEEMINLVRPMVDPDGAVTGTGYQLVVRTSAENLAELEQAINTLDTAPRQFLITVQQGSMDRRTHYGAGASGTIAVGDGEVGVGGRGSPQVDLFATQGSGDDRIVQRLRTLEGGWAHISAGSAMPVQQQTITQGAGGTLVQRSVEYRNVDTGFEVRPRMSGSDHVIIDVRPFRARPAGRDGVIEQQQVSTSVSTRLGEWVEIGGGANTETRQGSGIFYSTGRQEQLTRRVFVRVDLISD